MSQTIRQSLTPDRQEALLSQLRYLTALVESLPVNRACQFCEQFQPEDFCNTWGSAVPPEAQPAGCERWVAMIPF